MKKLLFLASAAGFLLCAHGMETRLSDSPETVEKDAAELLRKQIGKIDPHCRIVFDLAVDPKMPEEAWNISGSGNRVLLRGGTHGLFHAVSHYLRDICRIRYLSPYDTVTEGASPVSAFPARSGNFIFRIRDIHSTYGRDGGEFAVLRGLNGNSGEGIEKQFGGRRFFGPPYFVHTFAHYIPYEKYFGEHPEWFPEINGKRTGAKGNGINGTQLCLSNREMRREVLARLREYIARGKKTAEKNGTLPPFIYDISQNDNQHYCQCRECTNLAARYGNTRSGVLLDFINEIATAIAKEEPGILISTLAYQSTEQPPRNIRPAPNVLITLCDTASNVLRSVSDPENAYFHNLVKQWAALSGNLRIWDYNVTYQKPNEMPYNSEHTYQDDLRFFRDNGVTQVFTEFEYPVTADARDYKIFLKSSLLENPDADVKALSRRFADTFYGAAAPLFLRYRERLKDSQQARKTYLGMYPSVNAFTHLNLETVTAAQQLFDEGAKLLEKDPLREKRWRHARLSLDRATLILSRNLMMEYWKKHGTLDGYPFQRKEIAARILRTGEEQALLRMKMPEREKFLKELRSETDKYCAEITLRSLQIPEPFRKQPSVNLFDHTLENSARWKNIVELVDDPESDIGKAACLSFPNREKGIIPEKFQFPLLFGIYSPGLRKNLWGCNFTRERVKGPGYRWYKLGETKLSADCYMFFFWNWSIQQGVADAFDMNHPDQKFEIWLRMKFTGPAYPHGRKEEKNAIWIERIMLVRKYQLAEASAGEKGITVGGVRKYVSRADGNTWFFQYERKFTLPERAEAWKDELGLSPSFWRKHPQYVKNGIAGYNGTVTIRLESDEPVRRLDLEGTIANYADRKNREAEVSVSTDGKTFTAIQKITYSAGNGEFNAVFEPPRETKNLMIRFRRIPGKNDPAGSSFGALFREIRLTLQGEKR